VGGRRFEQQVGSRELSILVQSQKFGEKRQLGELQTPKKKVKRNIDTTETLDLTKRSRVVAHRQCLKHLHSEKIWILEGKNCEGRKKDRAKGSGRRRADTYGLGRGGEQSRTISPSGGGLGGRIEASQKVGLKRRERARRKTVSLMLGPVEIGKKSGPQRLPPHEIRRSIKRTTEGNRRHLGIWVGRQNRKSLARRKIYRTGTKRKGKKHGLAGTKWQTKGG